MAPPRLFGRARSWPQARRLAELLRTETVGGALLLIAALIALVWANSPWGNGYQELREYRAGPSALHLNLPLSAWAADGLLAIFFFVVGLELKREIVDGELRDPRRVAVPVVAAVGGMIAPALIYLGVNLGMGSGAGALRGWAIPTATDIAFALAVLAVVGSFLPSGLRAFLLTLAVVDDLLAIVVIAFFYSSSLNLVALLAAGVVIAGFAVLIRRGLRSAWLLVPLAVTAWVLMHGSGVHATIAGVLLGLVVPAVPAGGQESVAARLERRWRPVSAGVAVPVFAFFAAGVSLAGAGGIGAIVSDPVALGTAAGLVLGKVIGVLGTTFVMARFTGAELDEGLSWIDLFGVALLAGVGFTVSLLIGELAFGPGSERDAHVKAAVLFGSLLAATLACAVLLPRNAVHRRLHARDTRDDDGDGIPDVYQS